MTAPGKMPAQSVIRRYDAQRAIDRVAIPLIPQIGIEAAYVYAMDRCQVSKPTHKPLPAARPQGNSSRPASLPLFEQA